MGSSLKVSRADGRHLKMILLKYLPLLLISIHAISSTTNTTGKDLEQRNSFAPSLIISYLGQTEEDPPPFLVNIPTFYRKKNPNWYLRFRQRSRRSVKET